jgi:hypothetical protein
MRNTYGGIHLMDNRAFINGLIVLVAGFFSSSIASFLEHFAILGPATNFVMGFFDGLSVVAFGAAIFVLLRGRRTT